MITPILITPAQNPGDLASLVTGSRLRPLPQLEEVELIVGVLGNMPHVGDLQN
jgi:hypothetical protein